MAAQPGRKINLTKVPLAFAEGAILKKGARWNNHQILTAGTTITTEIIDEYRDVALHIPTSLRLEPTVTAVEALVEENIRRYKHLQKEEKVQDLSQTYVDGETIFAQGDTVDQDCYFLTEGLVDVVIAGKVIATIDTPGQPIGEMSFLTGEPRSASIVSNGPSKLLRIRHEERRKILRENPTIVNTLLEALVKRLGETSKRFSELQQHHEEDDATIQAHAEELASLRETAAQEPADAPAATDVQLRTLAEYAATEAGEKRGNCQILAELYAAAAARHAGAEGPAAELLSLFKGYLQYISSASYSKVADPIVDPGRLPPELRELLGR